MAVVKCIKCSTYIDDSEAVMIEVDDTHDAVYCIRCAPEDSEDFDSQPEDY